MPNINLKYFAIAIMALSVLIVAGALLFSLLNKPKITAPPAPQSEATQSAIPALQTPKRDTGGSGVGYPPPGEDE